MSEEHHTNYVKIWAILLGLLVVSVIGPEFGIRWLTLVTAFGIAVVKAYLVAKHFMHINLTPRFIPYLVATSLVFMFLFFAGTSPDVMKDEGAGWVKPAWKAAAAAHAAGETADPGAGHH
ncbi:MAG: cytochrome C oxidase subunit IV family protein [Myxococcota bacterium]